MKFINDWLAGRRTRADEQTRIHAESNARIERAFNEGPRNRRLNPPAGSWVPATDVLLAYGAQVEITFPMPPSERHNAQLSVWVAAANRLDSGYTESSIYNDLCAAGLPEQCAAAAITAATSTVKIWRRAGLSEGRSQRKIFAALMN